jgi:hypothetical protein
MASPTTPCYVEVVEEATGEVVKRMGPMGYHLAERVEDGVGINLDWDRFYTQITDVDGVRVHPDG